MNRKILFFALSVSLTVSPGSGIAMAHGFGGGGGFRGGGFSGGGYRGGGFSGGGYRGGYGGGFSGGSYHSSYSASGFHGGYSSSYRGAYGGGASYGSRGAGEGMYGGQINYGSRSGSYTTVRGGTVDYGAAGYGARGPAGGVAGRGVYGVEGTTAGGRSYADVGRAGGAMGPGGNVVGGRTNIGGVSGPNGTAVAGSRSGFAAGTGGVYAAGSRGGLAVGSGGAVAGRSFGASAYRPYGFNSYGAYHQGWVHGYWNGHDNAAWGWHNNYWGGGWGGWGLGMGMGLGVGMGLGWGLSSWGFGSALYGMGYMPYANPYYSLGTSTTVLLPYDYSQPINTMSAPADESIVNPTMALFDAGRASFKEGNYRQALQQADDALAKLPDDTTLHEFRALCLFALGRYDESAATLYAVLSVGPGWDWTTLIGLYPGIDPYTIQLRALEEYCTIHTDSAGGRFVLAYHYLTQGHTDAAVDILKQVVMLKPGDSLSARLLRQLDPPKDATSTAAAPVPTPTDSTPPDGATIAGTWNAKPAADTAVALTIQPGGRFTWQVTQKGREQQFAGTSTYGDGILTLAQDKGPALVGRVSWTDASHITFRIVGDGPEDPGLGFSK